MLAAKKTKSPHLPGNKSASAHRKPHGRSQEPSFTTDWFSMRIPLWTAILKPLLSGKPSVQGLELGTYEGRSAHWTLAHLLNGAGSHLTCIDSFKQLDPQSVRKGRKTQDSIKRALLANMRPYGSKFSLHEADITNELRKMAGGAVKPMLDFVYIDSDGSARDYLEQAVLVWPLLKPRGLLVFDDYTNSKEHDYSCPRKGIDAFLDNYAHELKVLHSGWQVILQKRTHRLPVRACKSEYYHEDLHRI
jgi:predicted O-methyltransferase YrrM